jgi:hypothetical protein
VVSGTCQGAKFATYRKDPLKSGSYIEAYQTFANRLILWTRP